MTSRNGKLPDYLLIYSEPTGWYLTDCHGNLFLTNANIRPATMLDMLRDAGANYQVIDPRQRIVQDKVPGREKGNPPMITEQITIDTGPYIIEVAKQKDLEVIQEVLMERKEPLTLDNARFVLAIGLKNKPAAWTVTPEELPALWADMAG